MRFAISHGPSYMNIEQSDSQQPEANNGCELLRFITDLFSPMADQAFIVLSRSSFGSRNSNAPFITDARIVYGRNTDRGTWGWARAIMELIVVPNPTRTQQDKGPPPLRATYASRIRLSSPLPVCNMRFIRKACKTGCFPMV